MMKNSRLHNNQGMTLVELMVAVALVAFIALFAYQFLIDQQKESKKIEEAIEYKIDTLLADKVILKDFRLASPSINQLNIPDNNGVNFFDYDPDTNGALYLSSGYKFRALTLDYQNYSSKKLYVLLVNPLKGDSVFTDPVVAYDVGAPPANINSPAPITFVGLNRNNFLNIKNPALLSNLTDLIYVDSSGLMKVTANNKATRSAAYIGFPNATGNVVASPALPDGIFTSKIYSKNGAGNEVIVTPTSFDEFLQELPSNGTSGSSIRISGVKLIKYELQCVASTTKCNLNRSEWAGSSGFINSRPILQNIKSVTFRRESITNTMATVSYVQNK